MADTPTPHLPPPAPLPPPEDRLVVTRHRLNLGDQTLYYTVTTGTLVLKEETERKGDQAGVAEGEKARATMFFMAYTLDDVKDVGTRPVTFSFNGGPGSASVWLHLGALGPRRVVMADAMGNPTPPPYRLSDNQSTLLLSSDLVFIDPISTGFSRVIPGEKARDFHGFRKDIESVGDFIRLYTTRNRRWASPKFLIGESYGTTRAAGIAQYLQERYGLFLNGLMLISAVLNFQTVDFHAGNDLPYLLHLPTYTATAWYHGLLPEELQEDLRTALREAEEFAMGDYCLALMRGDNLTPEDRAGIAARLARLTGLSQAYLLGCDLRLEIMRFTKQVLRQRGRTVGRLDSRYLGIDRDHVGEHFEYDPSLSAIMGPYTATLNQYIRSELNFESDLPYEILNEKVWPWSYADFENQYVSVTERMRSAMHQNPFLKIYVASGYYDLATPYFATDYTLSHLGLDSSVRGNISVSYFEAGHMMYVHQPSLERLGSELNLFVRRAQQS